MADCDWWVEDMEHNAMIYAAKTSRIAASMYRDTFMAGCVLIPEETVRREDGSVQTYWLTVVDENGELVNHLMVKPWNDDAQEATTPP